MKDCMRKERFQPIQEILVLIFNIYICFCHVFLSLHCSLVVTCFKRALLDMYVMFYCVFVTFACGLMGQVWCLIESIPVLCLLSYFYLHSLQI